MGIAKQRTFPTAASARSKQSSETNKAMCDTLSSTVWKECMTKEKNSHTKWVNKHGSQYQDEESDDEDDIASYEAMLKKMPQQNRVSLRTLQMRRGGLTRKVGSWSDKDGDPPRTPSQDVHMIRSKMPPLQKPIMGDLEGFNAHDHIPGYTGFFPGRKCKEYLLLKRADKQTGEQLGDLSMRYKVKLGSAPNIETVKTTNQAKDCFKGKLRDPDLADWANHRCKSELTEYVRRAIKLHVNIKASGHG